MKPLRFNLFFGLLLSSVLTVAAENCFDCQPLAEVAITNSGLAKIIEMSVNKNFEDFNNGVSKRTGFRDIEIDRSDCKPTTVGKNIEKALNKKKIDCVGLPNFSSTEISTETLQSPYKAKLSKLGLDSLRLRVITPISCKNLECEFKVAAEDLKISGDLQAEYTDKKENFIPKSKFEITTTGKSPIIFTTTAFINPSSGGLDDLVFIKDSSSQLSLGANSLKANIGLNKNFKSADAKNNLYQKYFNKPVKDFETDKVQTFQEKLKDAKFAENQFQSFRMDLVREYEKTENKDRDEVFKIIDKKIEKDLGGKKNVIKKLENIKWPNPDSKQEVGEFLSNPPPLLQFFPEIQQHITLSKFYAVAENSGYDNVHSALFVQSGVGAVNFLHGFDGFNEAVLQPVIEKELIPDILAKTNHELRNLSGYWNELSTVPSLDLQNLSDKENLRLEIDKINSDLSKLGSANSQQKDALLKKVSLLLKKQEALGLKIDKDWLPIDTKVLIDKNSKMVNMIRGSIMKNDPKCNSVMPKFTDRTDKDFDISTKIGVNTLQDYLEAMKNGKKLDICLDAEDPKTCSGGTKIKMDKTPKVRCEKGEIVIDIDADVKKSIVSAGVAADFKMVVSNCLGSPCLQIKDANGNFKNVFMNLFLGKLLDRGIASAINSGSKEPIKISIPDVKLKKIKSNPVNCEATMDWELQPSSAKAKPQLQ